jgi:hypothetical protein
MNPHENVQAQSLAWRESVGQLMGRKEILSEKLSGCQTDQKLSSVRGCYVRLFSCGRKWQYGENFCPAHGGGSYG